jgi:hypothetical protein
MLRFNISNFNKIYTALIISLFKLRDNLYKRYNFFNRSVFSWNYWLCCNKFRYKSKRRVFKGFIKSWTLCTGYWIYILYLLNLLLLQYIKEKKTHLDISIEFKRTVGAITSRLKQIAIKSYNDDEPIEIIEAYTGIPKEIILECVERNKVKIE